MSRNDPDILRAILNLSRDAISDFGDKLPSSDLKKPFSDLVTDLNTIYKEMFPKSHTHTSKKADAASIQQFKTRLILNRNPDNKIPVEKTTQVFADEIFVLKQLRRLIETGLLKHQKDTMSANYTWYMEDLETFWDFLEMDNLPHPSAHIIQAVKNAEASLRKGRGQSGGRSR